MSTPLYEEDRKTSKIYEILQVAKKALEGLTSKKDKKTLKAKFQIMEFWNKPTSFTDAWDKLGLDKTSDHDFKKTIENFFVDSFVSFLEAKINASTKIPDALGFINKAYSATGMGGLPSATKKIAIMTIDKTAKKLWELTESYAETATFSEIIRLYTEAKADRVYARNTNSWEPMIFHCKHKPGFENLLDFLKSKLDKKAEAVVTNAIHGTLPLKDTVALYLQNGLSTENHLKIKDYLKSVVKTHKEKTGTLLDLQESQEILSFLIEKKIITEKFEFFENTAKTGTPATEEAASIVAFSNGVEAPAE